VLRSALLLLPLAVCLAAASPASPASAGAPGPRISVSPATVERDEAQTVRGRGWTVFESCERRVEVKLKSAQNRARLGFARVRRSGRFRFEWTAEEARVGPGRWRLVVRMTCESGNDGSPVFQKRRLNIRIRS
jgi:hypothetical protein